MRKLHWIICGKHKIFENSKILYILPLALSIICSKYKNEDEKMLKEGESIEILRILGLIESM